MNVETSPLTRRLAVLFAAVVTAAIAISIAPRRYPGGMPHQQSPPFDATGSEDAIELMSQVQPDEKAVGAPTQLEPNPGPAWLKRYKELMATSASVAREHELEHLFELTGKTDPAAAMALAAKQNDRRFRERMMQAVLRGWGSVSPEVAAAWVLDQAALERGLAMSAVYHGAAGDPDGAKRLHEYLLSVNPDATRDYGAYLIAGLAGHSQFSQALEFAVAGPQASRADWINSAATRWASSDPRSALEYVAGLTDSEQRTLAFDAAISRWAKDDPVAAVDYSLGLQSPREFSFGLKVALRHWASSDPMTAANWMVQFNPSPALDFGAAILATHPVALAQPAIALSWAGAITDPTLRLRTTASVLHEWALTSPELAWQYIEQLPLDDPETLARLSVAFEPGFEPNSLQP